MTRAKRSPLVTKDSFRQALSDACKAAGGQSAWAKANGVSDAYVSDVLRGRRDPGEAMTRALGFERVIYYRRAAARGDGDVR